MTTASSIRVTEAEWLSAVGEAMDLQGWAWIHQRPGKRAHGKWATPTQGNTARGWPDIVACRPPRLLFLELKAAGGRVSPEQTAWLARLRDSGQEAHLIRLPGDWGLLMSLLAPDPTQLTLDPDQLTLSSSTGASAAWVPITGGITA
jgi:hypothetical protein